MALELLTSEAQNVALFNFDSFGKFFLILILVSLSAFYLFYYRKYVEKKTIYLSLAIVRMFFFVFSTAILVFVLPFSLFFISPEYTLKEFYSLFLIFWNMIFGLWLIVFTVDFFRYGFLGVAALGNLQVDKNSQEFADEIKKGNFFKYKI
jgi:hypothetical protein